MKRLVDIIARIPRPALFAAAAPIQIALVSVMVLDRMQILRQGVEVKLQTRAVDPRDLLRGDYVVLNYDISLLPAGDAGNLPRRSTVFVKLAPKADGFYEAVSAYREPVEVTGSEILMRGRTTGQCFGWNCNVQVRYGIEKYFVPQGEGRDIESARNQGKVSVVAAVTPTGRTAIKRLLIDGKPVYDEPLF
jgi:uncharacterized membrane-anchored protein